MTYRAERLNSETRQWELVGEAATETEASQLRPEGDWAEYRIRPIETTNNSTALPS